MSSNCVQKITGDYKSRGLDFC